MSTRNAFAITTFASLCFVCTANAQWISLTNQTTARLPVPPNTASTSASDVEEKDYAWGDVDRDGDIDLVVARKIPFTFEGGKINKLFMNEGGVLIDRTSTYANTSINVPGGGSNGFNDLTNDRDVILMDFNNDGWLDIITAVTLSDNLPRYIGHPRVYLNQGAPGGTWLGFVYDFNRIPQLTSKVSAGSIACNPRFCSVTSGDLDLDGYADLYFGAYDQGDFGPPMVPQWDMDNKLLLNVGAANPGFFVDTVNDRMSTTLLQSAFGAASIIADMNGDGLNDVVKQTSLQTPQHVAVKCNDPLDVGDWETVNHKVVYSLAPYFVSTADLNNDGRLDLLLADDSTDRYKLNTGNDANGNPNFGSDILVASDVGPELGNTFTGNLVIADLDNDGWKDAINCDVDVDTPGCTRRTRIFRNLGNAPNISLRELAPSVIPTADLTGIHDIAAFDLDGNGWKDLVVGECGAGGTKVWMNNAPANLAFSYPAGKPTSLTPGSPSTFQVQVTGINGGIPMPNSGKLYVVTNMGGAFTEYAMAPAGVNLYDATIPAQTCPDGVRYYVSAQLSTGPVKTDPPPAIGFTVPNTYFWATASNSSSEVMNETFEGAVVGWSVVNHASLTSGAWEVAMPNGTWNDGVRAAPNLDNTGAGTMCYVTGNGSAGGTVTAANVNGGPTELRTPLMDLTGKNARLTFAYWFYSNHTTDVLQVQVSNNDGGSWTTVASLKGPALRDSNYNAAEPNAWKSHSFTVGDYVAPTSQVRVRFLANDIAPASIVEAAIDDVVVTEFVCSKPPACLEDLNGDNTVGTPDLLNLINAWGSCPGCPADLNGDNMVGTPDLLALINAWGPCD